MSSSFEFLSTSNFPVTLDSRPPPQPPTLSILSTMSLTPQTQMGVSPRTSPGAAASGASVRISMKERLQTMRATSRAEAAARKLSGKEPGKSLPTMTNEMAVQANQSQSANVLQSQVVSFSRPQSVRSSQIPTPEQQTSPATPRSSEQASNNRVPSTSQSPREFSENTEEALTTAPNPEHGKQSQNSAPGKQMESRIDTQPLEVPVEVPLPLRVSQPDTHVPTHPSKLSFHEELVSVTQRTDSLLPTELGKMEFAIPLALSARVRDQYLAVMNINNSAIHSIENDDISNGTVKAVDEMLARLNRVTTHIDLDDPTTATQREETTAKDLAEWAEFNSEKFKFLRCLFSQTRNDQVHLAIVAQAGRLLDIVETFLKGTQIAYNRPDTYARSGPGTTKGRVEVSLIASGKEGSSAVPKAADLVIALDGSFRAPDTQVVKLRSHLTNVGQLAPVAHLLVNKSAEHIEKCISRTLNPIERVRRIVSCLTQVSHEVGHLQNTELSSSAAAEEVAAIVKEGGLEHYWESFPKMTPIERIVSMELQASDETDAHPRSERRVMPSSSALKRPLVCFKLRSRLMNYMS